LISGISQLFPAPLPSIWTGFVIPASQFWYYAAFFTIGWLLESRRDTLMSFNKGYKLFLIAGTLLSIVVLYLLNNYAKGESYNPEADGTVTVTITAPATSLFGYLNGLIIQAVPKSGGGSGARIASNSPDEEALKTTQEDRNFSASPNPFINRTTLRISSNATPRFRVSMVSADGKVVYEKSFNETIEKEVELMFNEDLARGVYLLRILEASGASHSIRLSKK
jgi:hypothetical protein